MDAQSKGRAEIELEQAVYDAAVGVFERLEVEGAICGNGHHAAQQAAAAAVRELKDRWVIEMGHAVEIG